MRKLLFLFVISFFALSSCRGQAVTTTLPVPLFTSTPQVLPVPSLAVLPVASLTPFLESLATET